LFLGVLMLTSIKKIAEGRYMLNDSVIISELDYGTDGVSYKIDYDEHLLTESEVNKLCDLFLEQVFDTIK